MNVTFPWPPRELSPNARVHWAVKSRHAKAYRKACWALAKEAKLKVGDGQIYVHLTFIPPDHRSRDSDNLLASVKNGLDGLADALKVNDSRFVLSHSLSATLTGGEVRVSVGNLK